MKNFIILIITYLGVISSAHSQNNSISPDPQIPHIYRYNVILNIKDTLVVNYDGTFELIQKYYLTLDKYKPKSFYTVNDNVGFRVLLNYDSSITPTEPLVFFVHFLDDVDNLEDYIIEESENDIDLPLLGGLKPVSIPPIDEDDEEGFPVETDEQQFIFGEPGEKQLVFELYRQIGDANPERIPDAGARGKFQVGKLTRPTDVQQLLLHQDSEITVYPNPIQSNLYITNPVTREQNVKAQISIYSTTGILLYSSELISGSQKQDRIQYHFQNPDLSPGVYYYKIQIGTTTYIKSLLKK